jgi:predicted SprT family Zn-dependent metalloprotease
MEIILFDLCIISMVKEYHCDCGAVHDNSDDIDKDRDDGWTASYYCTFCGKDIGEVGKKL